MPPFSCNNSSLCLFCVTFNTYGAKGLAEGKLTKLTRLNLQNNKIGDEGTKALSNGNLTSLESLMLSNNEIGGKGAKALANGNLTKLTLLNLSSNNIGAAEGAKGLAEGNLINLIRLDLSNNKIGDRGAKVLANGNLVSLKSLKLKDNNISNDGAKAFTCGKLTKLEYLDFEDHINDEVIKKLEAKLTGCKIYNKRPLVGSHKNNSKYYACGGKVIGLFLGLSIAYFAGATTLTPVGAVAVFLVAAVVGALVGYGIGKFCERVSEEKQNDPDISTSIAVKSVLCGTWYNKSPACPQS
ncbi:leucine-rich repeat domain-containing protein [Wolbachia endosymbiont of Oedothorax gibbosus]|uniref:hypothetical protein n=1 Tax=Wolbachia endosymbiont of Oedothorax gibbosus TaxID=931100 RepID=UPI002112241D|nr:hypothetical protein [Wolbachia endosymbiont of Oedothorax gibbosus]